MKGRSVVLPPLSQSQEDQSSTTSPQRQMTIDVKAKTLGYQLPNAEAEIQRIQELQRARRDEFMKRRQDRPVERSTQVAHWLERHSEQSLQDLGLATSSVPVRSILLPSSSSSNAAGVALADTPASGGSRGMEELFDASTNEATMSNLVRKDSTAPHLSRSVSNFGSTIKPDALGLSRYQIRGDLKEWLQRVEALNERLVLDGGDFTETEEAFLKAALERHVAQAVHKDAIRDDYLMKQSIKGICEMLENATRTPFAVREDITVKSQLDSLERQVQEMYSKVMKRGGFVYGSQVSMEGVDGSGGGSRKVESEGEIRKRQLAAGVAAAAQSQHILLTQVQLNQVLQAFYQQQRPANKREQGRMERQLVQAMVREDNITTTLRRRNKELSSEVEVLQETVQQLLEEKLRSRRLSRGSLVPDTTSEGSTVESLQQTNETIKEMSEVLARKAIRDINGQCDALRHERDELAKEAEMLAARLAAVDEERVGLQGRVYALEDQWTKHEEAKRQQEEERSRLFGGMRSDQQYYQSTIHKLLMKSSLALSSLVMCAGESENAASTIDWTKMCAVLDDWTSSVSFSFHFCEAAKASIVEVRQTVMRRMERRSRGSDGVQVPPTAPPQHHIATSHEEDLNRQLVNDLGQRLDDTISEAKAKFREARFMRSFVWYLIHCFDAMINGTYSDEVHGKRKFHSAADQQTSKSQKRMGEVASSSDHAPDRAEESSFPPGHVVALDADYAYAWSEEIQALERVFMGFRSRLSTSESQQGEVNSAVLRALECVGDARGVKEEGPTMPSGAQLASSVTGSPGAARVHGGGAPTLSDAHRTVDLIASLPTASSMDVRLAQTLEDHQRLPSGARAVDVATVLLLQIKEAKGHFSGSK